MLTATRIPIVVVLFLAVAVLVIVPNLGGQPGEPGRDGVLEIVMEGNDFAPSRLVIPAGEPVTLVFVNRNDAARNLAFGRVVTEGHAQPVTFTEDLLDGLDATVHPRQAWIPASERVPVVTLSVGGNSTVTVQTVFPAERIGTWQMACLRGRGCEPQTALVAEVTIR
jgi:hypothetical protein